MHTMKRRITLTIDPEIARRAKRIALARKTNVSALIEDLVRNASVTGSKREPSFVTKWTGKLRVRTPRGSDPRLEALKKRYDLK
jgi:hypothetical protein